MQTITHALNIKDTAKYGWIALSPESASAYMAADCTDSLTSAQTIAFSKLELLTIEACEKTGINRKVVKLNVHKGGHLALNYGNRSRTVISVSDRLLQGMVDRDSDGLISSQTKKLYQGKIAALSDDPLQLQKDLTVLSKGEMYEWLGLDQTCQPWLTDEEIYFILKHELAGHSIHNDNVKRFALAAVATVITLVGLPILLEASPEYFFVGLALCIGAYAVTKLALGRMVYHQEYGADLAAVKDDPKALRGGLSFLKKEAIREGIKNSLNRPFIFQNFVGHPSPNTRYAQLHQLSSED